MHIFNTEIPTINQLRVSRTKFNISQLNIVLRGLTQEGEASDIAVHEFLPKNFLNNLISTYIQRIIMEKWPKLLPAF